MSANLNSTIQLGDYIIIQRQKYMKLQKFANLDTTTTLGKEQLELRALLNAPYDASFKMCLKEVANKKQGNKGRLHALERCALNSSDIRAALGIAISGADNRNILDVGDSQALGPEDIAELRNEGNASAQIIEKIVENSKTFNEKTIYSQEKYLKKKEKKYYEFVQIRRPTVRLLAEIFYRLDGEKNMTIRYDMLSQMLSYAGISAFGNYLLYESGSNGMLPAMLLNAMGAQTEAMLIHMHPGNVPQKQALLALNFPAEQMQRCISVNIYSVLREFYQDNEAATLSMEEQPVAKKLKLTEINDDDAQDVHQLQQQPKDVTMQNTAAKWQAENKRACFVMRKNFDSLLIVCKEHPANILQTLLPLVNPSRPVVIFSPYKEILTELYVSLKAESKLTNLHLVSNWLRQYQILPNRTHPEVNMQGNGGYLLFGYTIN